MGTLTESGEYSVQYQRYSGGKRKSFDLSMDYLQGTVVAFSLDVEQKHNGNWKVLRVSIDEDETTADPDEALADFTELRWHVFSATEHGRKIPPAVAVWDVGNLRVAACLSDKYSCERSSLKKQEAELSEERRLCWWPDSNSWDTAKRALSYIRQNKIGTLDVEFFSFSKWLARANVKKEIQETLTAVQEEGDDPDLLRSLEADICIDLYAQYLRRIRTILLYATQRQIPARTVISKRAGRRSAAMADFLMEEVAPTGPLGLAGEMRAVISSHSHWPQSPNIDLVSAAIYAGSTQLRVLHFWVNPLVPNSEEKVSEALMQELSKCGVQRIMMVNQVLPFEVCPDCHQLVLPGPPKEEGECTDI